MNISINVVGHIVKENTDFHICGYAFDFTPRVFFQTKSGGKMLKRALRAKEDQYYFKYNGINYTLRVR